MTTPIAQYDTLLAQSDFLFLVYYRGHWCPFCMSYLRTLQGLLPQITAANGTAVIVTAEDAKFLPETLAKTGFTGATIVDPSNSLAKELKTRGLVSVAISEKSGYPEGMAQPAVLVVRRDGKGLVGWAIEPSLMNLGGAKDRVVLSEVWEDVQRRLKDSGAAERPSTTYSTTGILSLFK